MSFIIIFVFFFSLFPVVYISVCFATVYKICFFWWSQPNRFASCKALSLSTFKSYSDPLFISHLFYSVFFNYLNFKHYYVTCLANSSFLIWFFLLYFIIFLNTIFASCFTLILFYSDFYPFLCNMLKLVSFL